VLSLQATDAPEVAGKGPTPSGIACAREETERFRKAVERTPERYRELLWFLYEEDPSMTEVAEFLGKGTEASRKFVSRALNSLKRVV
jgi:DNA-directed RNA polymerase specialized sigma24 family protein